MDKLQHEYDTLILESHTIKKALKDTQQEILHCKYRNESAERAIGKLLKEKDESDR